MQLGEIVEALILVRDHNRLSQIEDEAVCAACNILDRFPNMLEDDEAKAWIEAQRGCRA